MIPLEAKKAWQEQPRNQQIFSYALTLVDSEVACPGCIVPLQPARILVEKSGDGGSVWEPEPGLTCPLCAAGYFRDGLILRWRPAHLVVRDE